MIMTQIISHICLHEPEHKVALHKPGVLENWSLTERLQYVFGKVSKLTSFLGQQNFEHN